MTYYEMAVKAGINMMPSRLYKVDGKNHFITQRFDRKQGKKIHTQTLAAMYPHAESYEQLITVCRKLHLPEADCVEVFRRMVFNILSNNTDDHNKNFSFIIFSILSFSPPTNAVSSNNAIASLLPHGFMLYLFCT